MIKKHFIDFELLGKCYRIEALTKENAQPLFEKFDWLPVCPVWVISDDEDFSYSILEHSSDYKEEYEYEKINIPKKFGINHRPNRIYSSLKTFTPFGNDEISAEHRAALDMAVEILKDIEIKKYISSQIDATMESHKKSSSHN